MMSNFEIIDSHMHVFDLKLRSEFPNQNWSQCFPDRETQAIIFRDHTQEEAKEMANKNGVKKAVFVMCYDDCPEEALWVYENAQRVELFIGIVAGLDLTQHEKLKATIDKFSKLSKPKFVGVRHHLRFTGDILFSDNFQKGLSILQESQIPFDFNDVILEHVVTIAQRFPKLKMVIDHLGKPDIPNDFEAWKKTITEIAQYPNVYMKLSGLVVQTKEPWKRELFQPYIDHCIREFGAKRCMYGSDWPVCKLAEGEKTDYGDVLELLQAATRHLSDEDRKSIFHDTVMSYYNLS